MEEETAIQYEPPSTFSSQGNPAAIGSVVERKQTNDCDFVLPRGDDDDKNCAEEEEGSPGEITLNPLRNRVQGEASGDLLTLGAHKVTISHWPKRVMSAGAKRSEFRSCSTKQSEV